MSLDQIVANGNGFAIYPFVMVYDELPYKDKKTGEVSLKWQGVKQLIFGDWIGIIKENNQVIERMFKGKKFIKVNGRGCKGYIRPEDIQANRVLEVNFIDVGQGDGCHLVTPDDKHYIIDAGQGDNMARFLRWRFNMKTGSTAPPVFKAVISHPDSDHYNGFRYLFERSAGTVQQFKFDQVFHNGLLELSNRPKGEELGKTLTVDNTTYVIELFEDNDLLQQQIGISG